MRLVAAVTAALLVPTAARACPPPVESHRLPTRAEVLRGNVERAEAIVYAVVERSIGHGEVDPDSDAFSGDPGTIRILHVYKGDLRVGQRLRLYGQSYESSCGDFRYDSRAGRTGAYGVLFLSRDDIASRQPIAFGTFTPAADVAEMIQLGFIRSARTAAR